MAAEEYFHTAWTNWVDGTYICSFRTYNRFLLFVNRGADSDDSNITRDTNGCPVNNWIYEMQKFKNYTNFPEHFYVQALFKWEYRKCIVNSPILLEATQI